MVPNSATKSTRSPLVSSFKVGDHTYERSYVDCGKSNCSRCHTPTVHRPSHGPYWYLCYSFHGKWKRIYLGKNLDTTLFITSNGHVDHAAIRNRRHTSTIVEKPENESSVNVPLPVPSIDGASTEVLIARSIHRVRRAERRAFLAKESTKPKRKAPRPPRPTRRSKRSPPP